MAKAKETPAPSSGGNPCEVEVLSSIAYYEPSSGAERQLIRGDRLVCKSEIEAKRFCWRGLATPVGWELPPCPKEETQKELNRKRNLADGIVTPDTRKELAARRRAEAGGPEEDDEDALS